jgi:hypothetical protein
MAEKIPSSREERWKKQKKQLWQLQNDSLNAVTIDIFQKLLHGIISSANKLLQGILLLTGRTMHENLVAGTGNIEILNARGTGKTCSGFPFCKKNHQHTSIKK